MNLLQSLLGVEFPQNGRPRREFGELKWGPRCHSDTPAFFRLTQSDGISLRLSHQAVEALSPRLRSTSASGLWSTVRAERLTNQIQPGGAGRVKEPPCRGFPAGMMKNRRGPLSTLNCPQRNTDSTDAPCSCPLCGVRFEGDRKAVEKQSGHSTFGKLETTFQSSIVGVPKGPKPRVLFWRA